MKIFKTSLINFLRSLKYIFTPLGVLCLFLVIGFSIAIPNIINSVHTLVDTITETFGQYKVNSGTVSIALLNFAKSLNTGSVSILDFTDASFLTNSLKTLLKDIFPNLDVDVAEVGALVTATVSEINIAFAVIFGVVGFVAGIFVTGSQIHSAIRKRTIGKLIIFAIIDSIISIAVIYLAVFSIASLGLWGIAITVALFIAQSIFSFFEGWLIHGRKVIKLRKVLNFKNVFFLLLSTIVIILIGVGITALVNLANMIAVTAIIALTLFIVSQVVIACNAESYVITMVEHDAKDALKEKVQTK